MNTDDNMIGNLPQSAGIDDSPNETSLNKQLAELRDTAIALDGRKVQCLFEMEKVMLALIKKKWGYDVGVEIYYNSLRTEKAVIRQVICNPNDMIRYIKEGKMYFSLDVSFYTQGGSVSKKVFNLKHNEVTQISK